MRTNSNQKALAPPVTHILNRNLIADTSFRQELDYVLGVAHRLAVKTRNHIARPQSRLLRRRIVANGLDHRPYRIIDGLDPEPPMRFDSCIGKL